MEREIKMRLEELYTSGEYLEKWPTWHAEESFWKTKQINRIMMRNHLVPATICEVGCGAGEILKQLQVHVNDQCRLWGYEISPQAFELCKSRANEKLCFKLADFALEEDVFFDLVLLIDVIEHVEDYFSFLRAIKPKGIYKIFHFPLDLSAKVIIQNGLKQLREEHGHVHYFTGDIALQMLNDLGYEVLDYFYTTPSIDLPTNGFTQEIKRRLMKLPRKLLFAINNDLAARVLGGYSLMVLAQ